MSKADLELTAERARANAYAPYSGFRVGAAVLTRSGKIFTGANVENASLGLTICAERVAIAAAVCAGEKNLVSIAISTEGTEPAVPCGACRQVMSEFNPAIEISSTTASGKRDEFKLNDLLPRANQGINVKHV
jgi:cytidine deaminase